MKKNLRRIMAMLLVVCIAVVPTVTAFADITASDLCTNGGSVHVIEDSLLEEGWTIIGWYSSKETANEAISNYGIINSDHALSNRLVDSCSCGLFAACVKFFYHPYSYTPIEGNDSQHLKYCQTCISNGIEVYEYEDHSFTSYQSLNNGTHKTVCSACTYEKTEACSATDGSTCDLCGTIISSGSSGETEEPTTSPEETTEPSTGTEEPDETTTTTPSEPDTEPSTEPDEGETEVTEPSTSVEEDTTEPPTEEEEETTTVAPEESTTGSSSEESTTGSASEEPTTVADETTTATPADDTTVSADESITSSDDTETSTEDGSEDEADTSDSTSSDDDTDDSSVSVVTETDIPDTGVYEDNSILMPVLSIIGIIALAVVLMLVKVRKKSNA